MWFGICAAHLQDPDLARIEKAAKNSVSTANGALMRSGDIWLSVMRVGWVVRFRRHGGHEFLRQGRDGPEVAITQLTQLLLFRCSSPLNGNSILQSTPSAAISRSTVPPSSCGTSPRISRVPYPDLASDATGGPPNSRHANTSFVACPFELRSQFTVTRPVGTDNAPYLAALVTSS